MDFMKFLPYLIVMAEVTYLLRMLPLVLIKKKITNRFLLSFLHYMPYAVLSVMTFPAVFFATGNVYSATVGVITALVLAFFNQSLTVVAAGMSAAVLVAELVITYLI
ncbi:MAG: AzlD domain-containing protein [Oscillospiraceae bacterium]|nr:AzlD domain-containing protein [Candidatus Equicaccousia limihippi]